MHSFWKKNQESWKKRPRRAPKRSLSLTFLIFFSETAYYEKTFKDIFFIKWCEEYEHIFCFEKKMIIFWISRKINFMTIFRLITFEIHVQRVKIRKKNLGVPVDLNQLRESSGRPDCSFIQAFIIYFLCAKKPCCFYVQMRLATHCSVQLFWIFE